MPKFTVRSQRRLERCSHYTHSQTPQKRFFALEIGGVAFGGDLHLGEGACIWGENKMQREGIGMPQGERIMVWRRMNETA